MGGVGRLRHDVEIVSTALRVVLAMDHAIARDRDGVDAVGGAGPVYRGSVHERLFDGGRQAVARDRDPLVGAGVLDDARDGREALVHVHDATVDDGLDDRRRTELLTHRCLNDDARVDVGDVDRLDVGVARDADREAGTARADDARHVAASGQHLGESAGDGEAELAEVHDAIDDVRSPVVATDLRAIAGPQAAAVDDVVAFRASEAAARVADAAEPHAAREQVAAGVGRHGDADARDVGGVDRHHLRAGIAHQVDAESGLSQYELITGDDDVAADRARRHVGVISDAAHRRRREEVTVSARDHPETGAEQGRGTRDDRQVGDEVETSLVARVEVLRAREAQVVAPRVRLHDGVDGTHHGYSRVVVNDADVAEHGVAARVRQRALGVENLDAVVELAHLEIPTGAERLALENGAGAVGVDRAARRSVVADAERFGLDGSSGVNGFAVRNRAGILTDDGAVDRDGQADESARHARLTRRDGGAAIGAARVVAGGETFAVPAARGGTAIRRVRAGGLGHDGVAAAGREDEGEDRGTGLHLGVFLSVFRCR